VNIASSEAPTGILGFQIGDSYDKAYEKLKPGTDFPIGKADAKNIYRTDKPSTGGDILLECVSRGPWNQNNPVYRIGEIPVEVVKLRFKDDILYKIEVQFDGNGFRDIYDALVNKYNTPYTTGLSYYRWNYAKVHLELFKKMEKMMDGRIITTNWVVYTAAGETNDLKMEFQQKTNLEKLFL
jgi:hypothetical protein